MFDDPRLLLALTTTVLGGAVGCSISGESCSLDTDEIAMRATVLDDDQGIEGEIELYTVHEDGGESSLSLCESSGDQLTINGEIAAGVRSPSGHWFYTVQFSAAAEEYEFTYSRDQQDEAIVARLVPPPSFQFDEPEPLSEHSRAADLEITWAPPGPDPIELMIADELGHDCLASLEPMPPFADDGEFTLPAGWLMPGADLPPEGNCDVDLTLSRESEGEYPAALAAGGRVEGLVKRRLRFSSVP